MSQSFDFFDKKLIVLFVLKESNSALSITQIVKLCSDFEDITYFDICEYIDLLKSSNYIIEIEESDENNTKYYSLTDEGNIALGELIELIPGVNLYNIKKLLSKEIDNLKKDYEIGSHAIPIKFNEYKVACYIKDGNDELVNITLYAGNKECAKEIQDNWQNNANEIYSKVIDLMYKKEG